MWCTHRITFAVSSYTIFYCRMLLLWQTSCCSRRAIWTIVRLAEIQNWNRRFIPVCVTNNMCFGFPLDLLIPMIPVMHSWSFYHKRTPTVLCLNSEATAYIAILPFKLSHCRSPKVIQLQLKILVGLHQYWLVCSVPTNQSRIRLEFFKCSLMKPITKMQRKCGEIWFFLRFEYEIPACTVR